MRRILYRLRRAFWRPWYRWCGLTDLAERYPAAENYSISMMAAFQTIQLKSIRWRNVAIVGPNDDGLFLQVKDVATQVPWDQVIDRGPARLYGLPGHALELGADAPVSLVVYKELYQQIAPWLARR